MNFFERIQRTYDGIMKERLQSNKSCFSQSSTCKGCNIGRKRARIKTHLAKSRLHSKSISTEKTITVPFGRNGFFRRHPECPVGLQDVGSRGLRSLRYCRVDSSATTPLRLNVQFRTATWSEYSRKGSQTELWPDYLFRDQQRYVILNPEP